MQFFQAKRKWLLLDISKPPKQDNPKFFGGYEHFMKRLNEIMKIKSLTAHRLFLESGHPEVTKNPNYIFPPRRAKKRYQLMD